VWGGEEGQGRLARSCVAVVGAGGLGSPLLYYLAAAGVGRIRVCDGDTVELSNLNRQILHDQSRLGMNKARSAASSLSSLNSEVGIEVCEGWLSEATVEDIVGGADVVCCAVDDLEATRLMGRCCVARGIPLVWGAAYDLGGFVAVMAPPGTPCVNCCLAAWAETGARALAAGTPRSRLLPTGESPGPIVGAAAGAAGSIQAMEVLKLLVGFGPVLLGRGMVFQLGGPEMGFRTFDMEPLRRADCPTCGKAHVT
jgi:adenylyltransferase/sulfurtransferase